jgi:DNA-binding transcriptional LysR family regulator
MRVDTEELRSFVVVGRLGSLTAAAALLNVSISALSRRIARIEAQTRLSLFHHNGPAIELTSAGHELVSRISPLLDGLAAALEAARNAGRSPSRLRIVGVRPAMRGLIPRAAAALMREVPGAEVDLAEAHQDEVLAAVVNGTATAGIGFGAPAGGALSFEHLIRDPLVLVCPTWHRMARRRAVAWREIEGERLSGLWDGDDQFGVLAGLGAQGAPVRSIQARAGSADSLLAMVYVGLCLAIMPQSGVPRSTRGVATPLLRDPGIHQSLGIWFRTPSASDPSVALVRTHLRSAAVPAEPRRLNRASFERVSDR